MRSIRRLKMSQCRDTDRNIQAFRHCGLISHVPPTSVRRTVAVFRIAVENACPQHLRRTCAPLLKSGQQDHTARRLDATN